MKSKTTKHFTLVIIFVLTNLFSFSQDLVSVYLCGMTVHVLGDENSALMPLKLDDNATFVVNIGGAIQYRKYFYKRFSLDVEQTFQADCGLKASLGTGISIGYDFIKSPQHQFIFAIGPGFFFRKSWYAFDGYIPVKELNVSANKKWEYIFVPIVPHVEYAFFPQSKNIGVSAYCIFDPINILGNLGFGVTYKLN